MVKKNADHEQPRANTNHPPAAPTVTENANPTPLANLAKHSLIEPDPWQALKEFTSARIALGRVGNSLPTKEVLNFGLAHAQARDSVHIELDSNELAKKITALGLSSIKVHSNAPNRASYLLRPDWGRKLNEASRHPLQTLKSAIPSDLLIVVGDGLSSLAIERQALPLIIEIQKNLPAEWLLGPIIIAEQARVALADEIGELMNTKIVAILIGERPGLSSPDSLGIYLTYNPTTHCTDADRNCISNVRPEGLTPELAAKKLIWLAKEAIKIKASGVTLKDESNLKEITTGSTPLAPTITDA